MSVPHPTPRLIAALVALWSAAPELRYDIDGVTTALTVRHGALVRGDDDPRTLVVGDGAQYVGGVAQGTRSFDLAGVGDQVDVACELRVWIGDTDPDAAARVCEQGFGVLDELARALSRDVTLGGVVDWARITRSAYRLDAETGTTAVIEFLVRADVRRPEGV